MKTVKTLTVLVAVAMLGGCAAMQRREAQSKESLLAAAGFQIRVASTPQQQANLQALTPRRIVPHVTKTGAMAFVYADPTDCNCVYVGDQAAYQRYQQLAIKQQLAQEQMMTAEMNEDAAMDWGAWGPFWW
jgi:hypothetical protein